MSTPRWQLLTTLSDLPSGEALAHVLESEGIVVRVVSDGNLLGQALPCRLFVEAEQAYQARWTLRQRRFTDEELAALAMLGTQHLETGPLELVDEPPGG